MGNNPGILDYQNQTIEYLLQKYRTVIGVDFDKYRNHVYRVFLNCLLLDDRIENEKKYAVTAVFHDIGIWTDHTIDYLVPSILRARKFLSDSDDSEWEDEMAQMIYWHHKLTDYKGFYQKTVRTFRKADWIDVSLGIFSFGTDRNKIREYRKYFPNIGFHFFLLRKIIKNFFSHPLNPFPMFKG